MRSATRRAWAAAFLATALAATAAQAMWKNSPDVVPVDRLVANLTKRLEKTPDDAHAHYTLGRIHSLAYALATGEITVQVPPSARDWKKKDAHWSEEVDPEFAGYETVRVERTSGTMTDARTAHFQAAVLHYRRATELEPKNALYRLGHAWLLDDGAELAPRLGWPDGVERKSDLPDDARKSAESAAAALDSDDAKARDAASDALRALGSRALPFVAPLRTSGSQRVRDAAAKLLVAAWKDLAFAAYVEAFRLALPSDLKMESIGEEGDTAVSEEAGKAIERLAADRADTEALRRLRTEVKDALAELAKKGRWITPVIFPVAAGATLADLVPAGRTALFDLDGDDVAERWPWPTADAAILVWRPDPRTPVTSGRQLFGSRTWWIFWRDGYEPLAALDDDGDRRLAGAELDGICVWRDRDGDGAEDAGEVVPAAEFGVVAIETAAAGREDGVPSHPRGIVLADGTTRPSFDWTPRRADDAPAVRP